jgi:hypothetical protein
MDQVFGFGNLTIETAGKTGKLVFRGISEPQAWKELLFALRQRARQNQYEEKMRSIRDELRKGLAPPSADAPTQATPTPPAATATRKNPLDWLAPVYRLWPQTWLYEGEKITWRKHWFVLIQSVFWPSFGIVVASVLLLWVLARNILPPSVSVLAYAISFVIFLGWFGWEFEDWRNDVFQITESRLIDLHRRPFFLGEERREAGLDKVQDTRVIIPNLSAHLFKYGTVIIETAGEKGQLVVDWVADPYRVQAEIARRLEAFRKHQAALAAQQRRQELMDWFTAYEDLRREATEKTDGQQPTTNREAA